MRSLLSPLGRIFFERVRRKSPPYGRILVLYHIYTRFYSLISLSWHTTFNIYTVNFSNHLLLSRCHRYFFITSSCHAVVCCGTRHQVHPITESSCFPILDFVFEFLPDIRIPYRIRVFASYSKPKNPLPLATRAMVFSEWPVPICTTVCGDILVYGKVPCTRTVQNLWRKMIELLTTMYEY